jgi:hypothetical protein
MQALANARNATRATGRIFLTAAMIDLLDLHCDVRNVGALDSAIQFVVCVLPIDRIDLIVADAARWLIQIKAQSRQDLLPRQTLIRRGCDDSRSVDRQSPSN